LWGKKLNFNQLKSRSALFGAGAGIVSTVIYLLLNRFGILSILAAVLLGSLIAWMTYQMLWARERFKAILRKQKNEMKKTQVLRRRQMRKAEYFERILQDNDDIIFTVDEDGCVLKFTDGATKNLGYTQPEIVGRPFNVLLQNPKEEKDIFENCLMDGRMTGREVIMLTKMREPIYVSLSGSMMRSAEKRDLIITGKNITDKKRLEMELIKKNKQLEKMVISDSLSGLYNVSYFHEVIEREMKRLKRRRASDMTLLYMDIDHFKLLNDTEGHQKGDEVIRYVGKIAKESIRQGIDFPFRYGGDEFVLLLPDTKTDGAKVVAQRMIQKFKAKKFGSTTLSIGIAQLDFSISKEEVVNLADQAMYSAKKNGGNQYKIAA